MILDDFAALTRERVPTPAEFLGFVTGMGWRVVRRDDGSPAIRAPRGETLAVALARMLAREPYRTGVLALAVLPPAPEPTRLKEWQFLSGNIHPEEADFCSVGDESHHLPNAVWWRYQGERPWRVIPGREHMLHPGYRAHIVTDWNPDEDESCESAPSTAARRHSPTAYSPAASTGSA